MADEVFMDIPRVEQMSKSFSVTLAQIQIARIRSDRERLFVQAEKGEIHGRMLLDRVSTP